MDNSRLTLTNRPENLRQLLDFIHRWSRDRSLSPARLDSLELVAGQIFRHLVEHAYQPDEPGSIVVALEEKGPRLRLMFEDNAKPPNPVNPKSTDSSPSNPPHLNGLQHLAESLIYYRTADRRNRLVVFLN